MLFRQQLRAIIEKRIGLETFADKLNQVTKHELYNKAAKQPQLTYRQANEVLFDYAFTRLYKTTECKSYILNLSVSLTQNVNYPFS